MLLCEQIDHDRLRLLEGFRQPIAVIQHDQDLDRARHAGRSVHDFPVRLSGEFGEPSRGSSALLVRSFAFGDVEEVRDAGIDDGVIGVPTGRPPYRADLLGNSAGRGG